MDFIEKFRTEGAVIADAPWSFGVCVVAAILLIWAVSKWRYSHKIETLEDRLTLRDDEIADYKRKLDGATPEEARARLAALEKLVGHLRPRDLTPGQVAVLQRHLKPVWGGVVSIGYAQGDVVCQDFADRLKDIFLESDWGVGKIAIISPWSKGFPGLGLVTRPGDSSPRIAAILAALSEAGIPFTRSEAKLDEKHAFRLIVGPISA